MWSTQLVHSLVCEFHVLLHFPISVKPSLSWKFRRNHELGTLRYVRPLTWVKMFRFLVACTRLYTLPCRSVGRSVSRSVRPSVTFLNSEWFLHYCSCPTVRDWIAVYPALFLCWDGVWSRRYLTSSKNLLRQSLKDFLSCFSRRK